MCKTKIIVEVFGGMVKNVYANDDVEVEVFDLDISDFPDEGECETVDQRKAEMNKTLCGCGWRRVW